MISGRPFRFDNVVITKVVDGDTVDADITVDCGFHVFTHVFERLRLARINAPEVGQPGADVATAFLVKRILHKVVIIETKRTDDYGRYIAEIWVDLDKASINQQMLDANLVAPWPAPKAP